MRGLKRLEEFDPLLPIYIKDFNLADYSDWWLPRPTWTPKRLMTLRLTSELKHEKRDVMPMTSG